MEKTDYLETHLSLLGIAIFVARTDAQFQALMATTLERDGNKDLFLQTAPDLKAGLPEDVMVVFVCLRNGVVPEPESIIFDEGDNKLGFAVQVTGMLSGRTNLALITRMNREPLKCSINFGESTETPTYFRHESEAYILDPKAPKETLTRLIRAPKIDIGGPKR